MKNMTSRLSIMIAVAALGALTGCDGQLQPSPDRAASAASSRPAELAPGWVAAPAPAPSAAESQAPAGPVYAPGQAQPDPEAYSHTYAPPPAPAAPVADAAPSSSGDEAQNVARTPPAGSNLRPNIANVTPARGAAGTQLTITGSDFRNVQVMIGSSVAQVTSQSSNAVTVVAPEGGPGPAPIVVTNRDGTYSVAGNAYQYM